MYSSFICVDDDDDNDEYGVFVEDDDMLDIVDRLLITVWLPILLSELACDPTLWTDDSLFGKLDDADADGTVCVLNVTIGLEWLLLSK